MYFILLFAVLLSINNETWWSYYVAVFDYNESEFEEMPPNEDGITIVNPGDDPETKTQRDTHRRFLERQKAQNYDR